MQITFYSPRLELTSAFTEKVEKSVVKIVDKAPFLLGPKKRKQDSMKVKVTVEKGWSGNFKLTIKLIFANQKIIVTDRGNDLYLLVDLVQQKLERKVRRYQGKRLKQEQRGAQLRKKLRIWPLKEKEE